MEVNHSDRKLESNLDPNLIQRLKDRRDVLTVARWLWTHRKQRLGAAKRWQSAWERVSQELRNAMRQPLRTRVIHLQQLGKGFQL